MAAPNAAGGVGHLGLGPPVAGVGVEDGAGVAVPPPAQTLGQIEEFLLETSAAPPPRIRQFTEVDTFRS